MAMVAAGSIVCAEELGRIPREILDKGRDLVERAYPEVTNITLGVSGQYRVDSLDSGYTFYQMSFYDRTNYTTRTKWTLAGRMTATETYRYDVAVEAGGSPHRLLGTTNQVQKVIRLSPWKKSSGASAERKS